MAAFTVKIPELRQAGTKIQDILSQVEGIAAQLEKITSSRVLTGAGAFGPARRQLQAQKKDAEAIALKLRQHSDALFEIADRYVQMEQAILDMDAADEPAGGAAQSDSDATALIAKLLLELSGGVSLEGLFPNLNGDPVSIFKAVFSILDKTEVMKSAELWENGIDYVKSLFDFLTGDKKGITGAQDFCDLTKSSSGVWSALYSFLRKFDSTKTSEAIGEFAEKWGKTNGIVGIIGSVAGYVDAVLTAADVKDKTGWQIAADGVGVLDDAAGVIKSVHEFQTFRELSQSTAAGKYLTIVDAAVSFFSQALESYGTYSADGEFDLGDIGATGVDASVSGLYAMLAPMVSKLTFGLISEQTTGVSAEDISGTLKDFTADWGTRAGNYIAADPVLQNAYNKSGGLGQVAISLYAIGRTAFG